MAHRLAQAGVLTVVMRYSLYPDVLVPHMVAELSQALTWTMDRAHEYRGDANNVSLVGHSAGAQMCAMALLHRAVEAAQRSMWGAEGSGVERGALDTPLGGMAVEDRGSMADDRMPARFIGTMEHDGVVCLTTRIAAGMAGVYDIAKHYAYETGRGVQELSTMKRAVRGRWWPALCFLPCMYTVHQVGGYQRFAAQSPAVLLARALRAAKTDPGRTTRALQAAQERPSNYYEQFALRGEAIGHRIGMERGATDMASEVARGDKGDGVEACLPVDVEAARKLPPTILMSSCTDMTVPWCDGGVDDQCSNVMQHNRYESAEMYMLHDCGVPTKHLVYDKVDHSLFVTGWRAAPDESRGVGDDLPACCGDLLRVLSGSVQVAYVTSQDR